MKPTVVRIISGTVIVAVLVSCLLFCKFAYCALMLFVMATAMHEFHRMTMENEYLFSRILSIVTGATLFLLTFFAVAYDTIAYRYIILAFIPLLAVMVNSLYVKDKTDFGKFANIYTSIIYISIPITITNLLVLRNGEFNGVLMLCIMAITCSCDVGAYAFGITLGQKFGKKLFPSISPKKSWIGFWGGLFTSILVAVVFKLTGLLPFSLIHCIILALILAVVGVYGDLFESQWKRHYGIKDSGSLIPGHGGMLDRIDSSLLALPMGTLYLLCFNLI